MERTDLRISDAHWDHEPTPSPLNGERARVRGEKAKNFEFPKVRFMESKHLHMTCTRIGAMNFHAKKSPHPQPLSHPMGEGGRKAG